MQKTIAKIATATRDRLPPDLHLEAGAGGDCYRFEVEGYAEPGFALVVSNGRIGVAWGSNATWIDMLGSTVEEAIGIVLNDPDETERRA